MMPEAKDYQEQTEFQVFKTVFMHSIVIIACPVISFFLSKAFIFDILFGLNTVTSNIYAAGVAMLILHVALGAFIYRAYFDQPTKAQSKED